jgi:hypothetical protein
MAWSGDPIWLADVLREAGLKVIEEPGWRQRGHGDFLDLRGIICHHTAGGGSNDYVIVRDGRPGLPGPLSQLVLERDGTFRVIAVGVAWHAGRGSWPGWPTNNANFHTIGIEAVNSGTGSQPWPAVQLEAYKRGCAAILKRAGLGVNAIAGHKEYSSEGKIDPWGIDMNTFRREVDALMKGGALEDELTGEEKDMLKRVHRELTQKYPSRSKYRKDDKPVDTLAGYVLNLDGRIHEDHVEREALKGITWAIDLVRREAAKGDESAKAVLAQIESGKSE